MLPVIGVPSYAVMLAAAVLFAVVVGPAWAARLEGVEVRATRRAVLGLAAAALAGGRLHVVLNYWPHYAAHPATIPMFWAGLHAGGAIVALAIAIPLVVRRSGIPVGRFVDALVPTFGVGIVLGRIGCFLHGCCFGTLSRLPWAVSFPASSEAFQLHVQSGLIAAGADRSAAVHPLQLYFAAVGLVVVLVGLWLHRRKAYDGQMALVALVLFSATSAWLEPFRAEVATRIYWGALPQLEWVALALTAASLAGLAWAEVVHRRRPLAVPA
jgi:phosphatidylglycerol:prolipoprotein diacylglycerol transferase